MDAPDPQLQAAVQQLVMEHGEYSPLELLLAANRLGYEDYRAWREGRLGSLDAVLAGGPHEVRAWLEGAQSWAEALGLDREPAVHHGWEENAGAVLRRRSTRRSTPCWAAGFVVPGSTTSSICSSTAPRPRPSTHCWTHWRRATPARRGGRSSGS